MEFHALKMPRNFHSRLRVYFTNSSYEKSKLLLHILEGLYAAYFGGHLQALYTLIANSIGSQLEIKLNLLIMAPTDLLGAHLTKH